MYNTIGRYLIPGSGLRVPGTVTVANSLGRLWGNAETTVTIIAASIPMLRVMIRDKARSQQVYGSSDYCKEQGLSTAKPNTRVVTISSGPMSSEADMVKASNDDDSDLDMLSGNRQEVKRGRIVQTNNFSLNYGHSPNKE